MALGPIVLVACGDDAAGKHWSELATCLAGPAASAPVAERVPKLRQAMLANPPAANAKDAWPKRCAPFADELYASLDNSGKPAMLKRKLHERFGCTDTKGSCAINEDSALISTTTELWEAAKDGELKVEAAANVPAPAAGPPPPIDAKSWKSFSDKPLRVSGPVLTGDGRALIALKTTEGRVRPKACEFAPGFTKVRCVAANDKVPELPPQSIEIVNSDKGLFAAGLTDQGLVAYDLESGETSAVGGRTGRLVRDGVVVERANKEDIGGGPADPTKPDAKAKGGKAKAKPAPKPSKKAAMLSKPKGAAAADEGFVAVELTSGKAAKPVKLPLASPVGDPLTLGNQILALVPAEGGAEIAVKSLSHGHLKDGGTLKGNFAGAFHTCRHGDSYAFATYAGHSGQGSAKPTGGEGKTAVTFSMLDKGSWSKPSEATMPFDRAGESDLVCNANGASITWLKGDKTSTTVGRIDCKADGCKSSDVSLPGFDNMYLWAVAPLGDKVLVLYRSSLGETRLRLAPLADLPTAKDSVVFDVGDYGGPSTGDLGVLASDSAVLLLFRGDQPVALRVGSDGTVSVVGT
ncbi:MAG TPA: hypothetical protein VGQ57_14280 [Polyangiaceae bacterium]|nr:hypothetical protein [Polyangiaceae bacterium]